MHKPSICIGGGHCEGILLKDTFVGLRHIFRIIDYCNAVSTPDIIPLTADDRENARTKHKTKKEKMMPCLDVDGLIDMGYK